MMRDYPEATEYEIFAARAVARLLELGTSNFNLVFRQNWFSKNIDAACKSLRSEYVLAEISGLSRAVIHGWRRIDTRRPVLRALLRLSYCFSVDLADWLLGPLDEQAFARWKHVPEVVAGARINQRLATNEKVRRRVLAYLAATSGVPHSVRSLATEAGTIGCRLYHICPDLVSSVVQRRAGALTQRKQQAQLRRIEAVRKTISALELRGVRPTRDAVLRQLKSQGFKCSWLLKEIFKNEIRRFRTLADPRIRC